MRSFVFLSAVLGVAAFLTVHYSFWVTCGIMYLSCMLVVAVIAFAGRSRQPGISSSVVLDDEPGELPVEGQTASEDRKAA